ELFRTTEQERRLAGAGVAVDPADTREEVEDVLTRVIDRATLTLPDVPSTGTIGGRGGRQGVHSEKLEHALVVMQSLARKHPGATW
ncbi:Phenylacetic acid catabolic protein, partial [Pseudonocardia spirodelae]